eukprot:7207166-Alexandrium_andersonii.AAC.1
MVWPPQTRTLRVSEPCACSFTPNGGSRMVGKTKRLPPAPESPLRNGAGTVRGRPCAMTPSSSAATR